MGFQRMAESRERADRIEADRNTIYSQMVDSRVAYTTVLRENASEQQTWNREEHTWKKEEHLWKREQQAANRAFKERIHGMANVLMDRSEEVIRNGDLNEAFNVEVQ